MKPAAEDEVVSGVMEGEDGGEEEVGEEQVTDGDAEGEEPERAESVEETVRESEDIQEEEVRKLKTWRIELELYFNSSS